MLCRHCQKRNANRPRGLCWHDYYTPGVRDMYPPTSIHAIHGHGLDCAGYALPEPTAALPGSAEKVAVLEDRARRGLALFHPADATWDPDQETDARAAFVHVAGAAAEAAAIAPLSSLLDEPLVPPSTREAARVRRARQAAKRLAASGW